MLNFTDFTSATCLPLIRHFLFEMVWLSALMQNSTVSHSLFSGYCLH